MRALRCCLHLQLVALYLPNNWFTVLSQVSDRALGDGDGDGDGDAVAAQLAAHVAADILILLCDAEPVEAPPSHSIDVFHPNTAFATGAQPPAFHWHSFLFRFTRLLHSCYRPRKRKWEGRHGN
jgi:hypothetical protein